MRKKNNGPSNKTGRQQWAPTKDRGGSKLKTQSIKSEKSRQQWPKREKTQGNVSSTLLKLFILYQEGGGRGRSLHRISNKGH